MRHVVTSFQLLNRTFNMGPVFRVANPDFEHRDNLPSGCVFQVT